MHRAYRFRDDVWKDRVPARRPAREDERVERYLRSGSLAPEAPERAVLTMQRMVGNRAIALAMAGRTTPTVQRLSISGVLDRIFGSQNKAEDVIDEFANNRTAWKHFRQYCTKEYSTENLDFYDRYQRAKARGGGADTRELHALVESGDLNLPGSTLKKFRAEAQQAMTQSGEVPLSAFDAVFTQIKVNLSDSFARFKTDPSFEKAQRAITRQKLWRGRVGRLFGEKQSQGLGSGAQQVDANNQRKKDDETDE
ncbi:MAG TPA: hypothetical protein VKV23_03860 [Acidimicrobiales bacterium]|nr:hypothetical protein [Acidimicrobiales bacterium]